MAERRRSRGMGLGSPFKLHLHRWIEKTGVRASHLLVETAQTLVSNSEPLAELCVMYHAGDVRRALPGQISSNVWLRLYEKPGPLFRALGGWLVSEQR